jgi:hypothetical protein
MIERVGAPSQEASGRHLPCEAVLAHRLGNAVQSLRWNAQLNRLWSPERRSTPNEFVRQTANDVVAAIPNPDVNYTFGWWQVDAGQALLIDVKPPPTRYWSLQICDRWFQCFPDRRTNLHDREAQRGEDGLVQIILAEHDPGVANWLETSGHRTGVMFFRWLHTDVESVPTCKVVPIANLRSP